MTFIEAFDLRRGDLLSLNFRVAQTDNEFGDPNTELGEERDGKDDDEEAKNDLEKEELEEEDDGRLRYEFVFKVNMAPAARVLLQNFCFLKFRVGEGGRVSQSTFSGIESEISGSTLNEEANIAEEMDEVQEIQQEIPSDLLNIGNVDKVLLPNLETESSTDDFLDLMNVPQQQQMQQKQMPIQQQMTMQQQLRRSRSTVSSSIQQSPRKAIIFCHRYPVRF